MIKTPDEFVTERRPIAKSENDFEIRNIFSKDELMGYSRLCSEIVLKPGDLIPLHAHENEAEIFLVLEGELVSIGEDGAETPFNLGSYMLTGNGAKHSLRNDSGKDARIMAVIML